MLRNVRILRLCLFVWLLGFDPIAIYGKLGNDSNSVGKVHLQGFSNGL